MAKQKYTSEQKYRYHSARQGNADKFGIKYGGTKYMYSAGFTDGFHGIDNTRAVKKDSGTKVARSYSTGRNRGRKAAFEYFSRTGKQPGSLR